MSRLIDSACELEQWHRERELAHHFEQMEKMAGTGACCDCGQAIEPARLAINPHFARCVMCQDIVEHRKKHVRRT